LTLKYFFEPKLAWMTLLPSTTTASLSIMATLAPHSK
jgi:hypothetical protein